MLLRFLFIFLVIIAIDIYAYQAFRTVFSNHKNILFKIYWGFTALSFLAITAAMLTNVYLWPKPLRLYVFAVIFIVYLSKLFVIVFLLVDDIQRLFRWLAGLVGLKNIANPAAAGGISRSVFINRIGLLVAAVPLTSMFYGMLKGGYDYTVRKSKVPIKGLPDSFVGLKVLQISDLHLGSFLDTDPLERAVGIINSLKADVVFFTGDLVNNTADETDDFKEVLSKITAPMGVYSIFGNHDYGDYRQWSNAEEKVSNLNRLKEVHKELGWNLLLNQNTKLQRGTESITIVGMENWGAYGNFSKYGNLEKALMGAEPNAVKILLSHDPSHWTEKVSKENPDIQLTLSGHTHGMQFGVEIPGFKWSPIQYMYKNWAGLYEKNGQYLYVNRGLGFLGFPGRVGIWPEITVLELVKG